MSRSFRCPLTFTLFISILFYCVLTASCKTCSCKKGSVGRSKNRQLLGLCPNLRRSLCSRENYTALHTAVPDDVVKAVAAKYFLNTFGCGPSYAIAPSNQKFLLQRSCGSNWLRKRRAIDMLLCDHVALWAGADMIQRCTINETLYWGNDECFDLLKYVWPQEQRSILCSTFDVDRNNSEYRHARRDMKCLGYYPTTRRQEICTNMERRSVVKKTR
jgi:hypothetical protein